MEQFLGLPPDGSAHGPEIDHLIGLIHWLMILLFVGWGIFYTFILIRFRKSRNPAANYRGVKSHFSSYLEVGVIIAEAILLVAFSIPLWSKRVDAFPREQDATIIRVTAEQFAWNVHYPGPDGKFGKQSITLIDQDNPLGLDRSDPDAKDDIVTLNNLNLPVNKPVIVYLTSKDVIHSFYLPAYRVKQDAIPGSMTPLWFTPTKTTDEIREGLRSTYPIAEVMRKIRPMPLPAASKMSFKSGDDMEDDVLMEEFKDSSGNTILAKGEHLDTSNTAKLADAGIRQAMARPAAGLDKYVVTDEIKDKNGATVAAKSEALSEETVTKLVDAGITSVPARKAANMDAFVVMENYTDKSGGTVASKGDALTEELIAKFSDAGIGEITIAPATPTEIACAQLCGLGHFRMRGYMTVQTPEEYKKWFDEQEASLQPPAESGGTGQDQSPAGQTPPDTTAALSHPEGAH